MERLWGRVLSERESDSTLLALIVVFDLMLVYQELLLKNMKNYPVRVFNYFLLPEVKIFP